MKTLKSALVSLRVNGKEIRPKLEAKDRFGGCRKGINIKKNPPIMIL